MLSVKVKFSPCCSLLDHYMNRAQNIIKTAGIKIQSFLTFPICLILFCSWWVVSLIWRQTSLSRMRKASAAWWSCWSTVTSPARPKSGACSPPSFEKVFVTCKQAPRWASSSRCCSKWARWMTWLQVWWWCEQAFFCSILVVVHVCSFSDWLLSC